MYKEIISSHSKEFGQGVEHLANDLSTLRTGRANPGLVENIMVESYGSTSPLKNIASITVPDPRTLAIQPWDKSLFGNIEKAITSASLGIQAINDGNFIRLNIPQMTEERRLELVKVLKQYIEAARIRVRNVREIIWKEIVKLHKEKKITDDQKYEAQEELSRAVEEFNKQIETLGKKKETELISI